MHPDYVLVNLVIFAVRILPEQGLFRLVPVENCSFNFRISAVDFTDWQRDGAIALASLSVPFPPISTISL